MRFIGRWRGSGWTKGALRKMKTDEEQYEVKRIIKAFVNADVVKDSLEKLKSYAAIQND